MADEVIRRQGSATDHQSFTGAAGELTVENTNWNLRVHDGATAGGFQTAMVTDFGGPTTAEVGKGAIVESGTNANGSYVRWENGEQVCVETVTLAYNSALYCGGNWTFPAAFSSFLYLSAFLDSDSVFANAAPSFSEMAATQGLGETNTSTQFRQYRVANTTDFVSGDSVSVRTIAWGFWK